MKAVTGVFNSSSEGRHAILKLRALGISDENLNFLTPSDAARELKESRPWKLNSPEWKKRLGQWWVELPARPWDRLAWHLSACLYPGWVPSRPRASTRQPCWQLARGSGSSRWRNIGKIQCRMAFRGTKLFVYEDALRRGRTVVIALAKDDEQAEAARTALEELRAESIDAGRKQWWIGLRDAEAERYSEAGRDFTTAESVFQEGFTAAFNRTSAAGSSLKRAVNCGNAIVKSTIRNRSGRATNGDSTTTAVCRKNTAPASRFEAREIQHPGSLRSLRAGSNRLDP